MLRAPASPARTRPSRRRLIPLALSSAALLALSGCGYSDWSETHRETRALRMAHVAGSALSIGSENGKIEALSTDREDVSIEVSLQSPDLERLQLARVVAHRDSNNTLHVRVDWPDGKRKSNEGASISINLPDARDVTAHSSNGSITIAGLGGHADLKSTNGTIRVDTHDGSVYANTSNGKLFADRVSGDIEMYSSNGSVTISDAFGSVRAESSNGSAVVTTMPGNTGPVRIRTSNGPITLNLGEGLEGILKCDTTNGRVTVTQLPKTQLIESSNNSIELRVGQGDEISALRTTNGSIRVQGR
ncbi:MAG: hypothetical protein JJ916_00515 [Phycisphaerales bacterium]|nr:hypothetical protein [Phycisphaerales bacterium]